MNPAFVAALETAGQALLLTLAFLLPTAAHLKAFDPFALKTALLAAGGLAAAALWLARSLEAGRVEVPRPRAALAAGAALLLAWTVLRAGHAAGAEGALARAAGPALFLVVLLGPASAGFARSLAWTMLSSAALVSLHAVLARLGLDPVPWDAPGGVAGSGMLAAATALAALPLSWPLAADPESTPARRGLARGLAVLCLAGAAAALSNHDAASAAAAASAKLSASGRLGALLGTQPWLGLGAGEAPFALLWGARGAATALMPVPPSEPLATAAELGVPAALLWTLLVWGALSLAALDARRRFAAGDARTGTLAAGQAAALAVLGAAGLFAGASYAPAGAAWLWLLAGSAAGLALEAGASVVRALPFPFPPAARRLLLAPVLAAAAAALILPAARLSAQLRLNRGAEAEEEGDVEDALRLYRSLPREGLPGLQARLRSAELLLRGDGRPAAEAARAEVYAASGTDPLFGDQAFLLAEAQRRCQSWKEAEEAYTLYAALNPADPRTYTPLADVLQTLGRPREAVEAAKTLVAVAPLDPEAWRFYAEQVHSVDPSAARPIFAKAAQVKDLASRKTGVDLQP
ncbi:hypothetical protein EPO15_00075 [bacterium]|nr:MAG: hypothetical protein EPO15_00075 [bacterium]